jgi:hypothetical protein
LFRGKERITLSMIIKYVMLKYILNILKQNDWAQKHMCIIFLFLDNTYKCYGNAKVHREFQCSIYRYFKIKDNNSKCSQRQS